MYTARKKEPVRVPFDADKINALLGTDIPEEDMIKYLKRSTWNMMQKQKK